MAIQSIFRKVAREWQSWRETSEAKSSPSYYLRQVTVMGLRDHERRGYAQRFGLRRFFDRLTIGRQPVACIVPAVERRKPHGHQQVER